MDPSTAEVCSNPTCSEPGTLKCGRCKSARYCGQDCQRSQWSAHKAACKAASKPNIPKSNCYILRAAPQTANAPVLDNIAGQIVPFNLSDLGNESKEKRQLEKHLGWKGSMEVGKFYDHSGTDKWYYYVYGDARAFNRKSGLPVNEAAGLVCHKRPIYGDVGIVRSGPMGSEFAEEFSKTELAEAVEFYKTNDKDKVFAQREMSRATRTWGVPGAECIMATVLLVVDMQLVFLNMTTTALPNILNLCHHFKASNLPLIFTQHGHSKQELTPPYTNQLVRKWGPDGSIATGSKDWKLIPEIEKVAKDYRVVAKNTYDAFINTDLGDVLEKGAIERVVVCGVMTDCCCDTTARSAFNRGYETWLVRDACGSANSKQHEAGLRGFEFAFGEVLTTEEVLKRLK